jgi:polyhydroxyalkanoate synthesis regulator phasin
MKMSRKTKIATGAIAALVLAITVGAAGAIAASRVLSGDDESQAVIDDAAKQLGVTPSALEDALREALKNRVDDAVEAGRLTEEQGKALKERIDARETPLPFGGLGRWGLGHFGHFGHFRSLDAAASYLDLTEAELRERLADGDTLAEVAKAEGKSVDGLVKALVAAATEKLDDAVADGRLTEERAAELKQGLEERVTDLVNGEFRAPRLGPPAFGFDRGFGFRFHRGSWEPRA